MEEKSYGLIGNDGGSHNLASIVDPVRACEGASRDTDDRKLPTSKEETHSPAVPYNLPLIVDPMEICTAVCSSEIKGRKVSVTQQEAM